ncbi:MAG: S41 family peptidase [Planctomycetota bacterium]|jgi:hypothetical protein
MNRRLALLWLAATAAAGPINASFEEGLKGWRLEVGAHRGAGPASQAELDREVARGGEASLRFAGDAGTIRWWMATQDFACRGGERVMLLVAARCRNLRREANQYVNANSILIFHDERGKRLAIVGSPVLHGDRDWVDLGLHALAPPRTATVKAGLISSMSGTVWFDDVRLTITHTEPRDQAARAAAFEALRWHLDRTYPHFGVRARLGARSLPANVAAKDFAAAVDRMLAPLRDVHIAVETPEGRSYTVVPNRHPPNWNETAIRRRLTETLLDAPPHLVGRIGKVGYARVGTFLQPHGYERVEDALDRLAKAPALILDVRPNPGGDERLAWRLAGRFTDREVVYGKAQVRDPTLPGLQGFGPLWERKLKGRRHDPRQVVVLQGPYTASSAEWFLLMMRAAGKTTMGLPSRGASGNPQPFQLFSDISVHVPTWRGLTRQDKPIEGVGVPPQVRVEASHQDDDPTLEKALEHLR